MQTIHEVEIGGLPIKIEQSARGRFTVTYWKQVRRDLSYGAAAREFGECVFHALACEGKLDNEKAEQ